MQKSSRSTVPLAVRLRYLVKTKSLLRCAIEIEIALIAGFLASRDECLSEWVGGAKVGDVQWPGSPVIFRGSVLLVFRFLEIRQNIGITPSRIPQITPLVIVGAMATNVDHGVDRAAS